MEKRSLTIAGHRTSVALEPEFWEAVEAIAAERGLSPTLLVREIDGGRESTNLSSAIRVAVLRRYRQGSSG